MLANHSHVSYKHASQSSTYES